MTTTTYISTNTSGTMLSLRNSFRPAWPDAEASICSEYSWLCPIKGTNCWSIQGPALQAYNAIRDKIKQCLTDMEKDLYEDQDESSVPHRIDCLMVGREAARARPYIIISCGQQKFCRKVMQIVKQSVWWGEFDQNHPGFGGFILSRFPPRRIADMHQKTQKSWVYTSDRVGSLYGASIFFTVDKLGLGDACLPRQATLGGIIYLNGEPFGLTVAHPLQEQARDHISELHAQQADIVFYADDSDGETSSNSDSTSLTSNDAVVSETIQDERLLQSQPLEGCPHLLGQLTYSSEGTPTDGIDWGLITLDQFRGSPLQKSSSSIGTYLNDEGREFAVVLPKTVACPGVNPVPVFSTGEEDRLVQGFLSLSESLVCLPGSRQYLSLYSVNFAEVPILGDCGKWVFDHQGNWYGHVVAGVPEEGVAYIAPAHKIIGDIRAKTGIESISLTASQGGQYVDITQVASCEGRKEVVQLPLNREANVEAAGGEFGAVDPASGLLSLTTSALQSSVALHSTIQSFQSHDKRIHDLVEELGALQGALRHLNETVANASDLDLSLLGCTLLQCTKACKDFENGLLESLSGPGGDWASFRDFTKLEHISDDADGFRRLLAGYKLTICIALTDITLHHQSFVTAENLKQYEDLIRYTTADLQRRLDSIDNKLDSAVSSINLKLDPGNAELSLIQEERLSTRKCLRIYEQLSHHVDEIQFSIRQDFSPTQASNTRSVAQQLTDQGLDVCRDNLVSTTKKLENYMKGLTLRSAATFQVTSPSPDEITEITRLQNECDATRQCIEICSAANEYLKRNFSMIDNCATDDAVQLMVSTNHKVLVGKNRGVGWRTRQVGGHLNDATVLMLSRDMERDFSSEKAPTLRSKRDTRPAALSEEVRNAPETDFQEQHGHDVRLAT